MISLFISRPVATTLLTLAIALAGSMAFFLLPVAPLPQVDFATIAVSATMPGASPETMATSVATPLERHLGQIADVTEMTSTSSVGQTQLILQFGFGRDIDGAARDVQAGINAARADLPTNLKTNPTYKKVNPADAPIMILAMTSAIQTPGQLYDSAATILQQKLSQVNGIGQVTVGGSSLPAVRVELNPYVLFKYSIGFEDIRAALASANANSPKGTLDIGDRRFQFYTNDQASKADQYRDLIVAYRNGAPVHLSTLAEVNDGVEDLRNQGLYNGDPAVLLILYREPGANIINTVDKVKSVLPELRASIPRDIDLNIVMDRTTTIRASLHDVEHTLLIAIALVILVVFDFLRDPRATFIPAVAVVISLIGTFGVMYLLGYSLNNLSLMALTIGTGFVVDDAIVVLENVVRHREAGMSRMQAALQGANEVGFTVLSMSLSLIAVFIPILLMEGMVGRLLREFAVTLSAAILVSLLVSLTTTPMMCSRLLVYGPHHGHSPLYHLSERLFQKLHRGYEHTLDWSLSHSKTIMMILLVAICLNIFLFITIPKGFFPLQDTGRLIGSVVADQSISFQSMKQKMQEFVSIVKQDPAVATVVGFTGGGQTNSGFIFSSLKPVAERNVTSEQIIARLRKKLASVSGATLFLQSAQDIRVGGRLTSALYQYTVQADRLDDLWMWAPKLTEALKNSPELIDVNSDQQDKGLEIYLDIDRQTMGRLGLTASQVDNTLYDAFGQRQVSIIYNPLNQYYVIMELAPPYWQNPQILDDIYVSTAGGPVGGTQGTNAVAGTVTSSTSTTATIASDAARNQSMNQLGVSGNRSTSTGTPVSTSAETVVPLSAFTRYKTGTTPLVVNHQGHFAASTISFNLPLGKSLGDAVRVINRTMAEIGAPSSVHGNFQGTAQAFQNSLRNEPLLIIAALIAIYIVLGILYESTIHPITILSTLPSAGVGAVLALMVFKTDFTIIALIGVILLIGIVKKNAIMMIDFALEAERHEGLGTRESIRKACLMRFRPIMMTTMVALLGALPLALGSGDGAELRRPLGIAIVGGLIVSQMLTLYTTPVVYLYLDRFQTWLSQGTFGRSAALEARA